MTMTENRGQAHVAAVAAVLSVLVFPFPFPETLARAGEDERVEAVYFPQEGMPRGTVLLRNLRSVAELPVSAAASILSKGRLDYEHIGVLVPEGAEPGDAAWMEAPLITVEDAVWTVLHDERDGGRDVMMAAGYSPPGAPPEERKPWLEIATEHRRCDFAVAAEEPEDARGLELLEVAALASPWKIYLRAITPEGEPVLVEADYGIVRDAKGLRDLRAVHDGARRSVTAREPGDAKRRD